MDNRLKINLTKIKYNREYIKNSPNIISVFYFNVTDVIKLTNELTHIN